MLTPLKETRLQGNLEIFFKVQPLPYAETLTYLQILMVHLKNNFPSLSSSSILYRSEEQAFSDTFPTKLSFLDAGLDPF